MPALLPCKCGKTLKIPDGIAPGTRVKCRNCMAVLVVPGASASGDSAAVRAKPPVPAAKPVVKKPAPPIEDDEEELEERPTAKRPPAKPTPKKPVPPDDEEDEVEERLTAKKPTPKASPMKGGAKKPISRDEDDEEDDDDLPPSRLAKPAKKSGSLMPILLASLVGFVAIGGAAAAYILFFSGPSAGPIAKNNPGLPPPGPGGMPPPGPGGMPPGMVDPIAGPKGGENADPKGEEKGPEKVVPVGAFKELTELPMGSAGFIQVRVRDWWNGPSGKKFQETKHAAMVGMMKEKVGLSPEDIDFVRFAIPVAEVPDPKAMSPKFVAVTFTRDIDWEKLREAIPGTGPKEVKGERFYFSIEKDKKEAPAVVPLNARAAVLIDMELVNDYLDGKMEFDGTGFASALKDASGHHVYATYAVPAALLQVGEKFAGGQKELDPLKDTKKTVLKIRDSSPLQVEVQLTFGDAKSGEELQKTAEGMIPFADGLLGAMANGPDAKKDPALKSIFDVGSEALKKLKLENQGTTLTATTTVSVTLGSLLPALFDRFSPMAGGLPPMGLEKKD